MQRFALAGARAPASTWSLILALFASAALAAQDPGEKPGEKPTTEKPGDAHEEHGHSHDFKWETGKVMVKGNRATIDLPAGWRYLQQAEARHLVEEDWGNPPDPSILGLLAPPGDELDWAIIVSFDDSGYVSDSDAAGLDYNELLKSMQTDAKEANAARKKQGYPTVDLLGWAEPPHYDAAAKKIYWAKSLSFEGAKEPTLNYCVRILAADGVLEMNAVAKVTQLKEVSAGAKEILARSELAAGQRYADHNPSVHKVAAYGIGGLIAGKVLLKAGIFKVLLKPLIVVGVVVVGLVAKMLGKKKSAPASA